MAVKHWMTNDVITVKADTSLLKCRNLMKEKNIRRVPVVDDDNHVIGIISDRDVKSASPSKATALEVHHDAIPRDCQTRRHGGERRRPHGGPQDRRPARGGR